MSVTLHVVEPRLSPQEELALARFSAGVRALVGERVRAITLFGSRARGEGRDDSDLDVLVVVHALSRADRIAVIDLAADVGVETGLALSPLVVDEATFRWDLPLGRGIRAEGKSL